MRGPPLPGYDDRLGSQRLNMLPWHESVGRPKDWATHDVRYLGHDILVEDHEVAHPADLPVAEKHRTPAQVAEQKELIGGAFAR